MPVSLSPAQRHLALSAANRRGIAAMTIAMGFFVSNDAIVKFVSQSLPSAQLIFIRGVFASVFLLAVARHMGFINGPNGHLRQLLIRPVLLRAAFDAVATMVYLTALFHLPLGNATAINLATPLFITLMAMLTLGERVGAARWLIISVGFAGVLLVVQPRAEGFNAWALLCVLGTFLHAVRDTLTRTIPTSVPSVLITVSTALAVTLLSGLLSIPQGWKPVEASHLALLAVAAVFLGAGYYLLINAMRAGEMSVIAPFRYSGLLFALVIGYLVWSEMPNTLAWACIALLVVAGLTLLLTERTRNRARLEADADVLHFPIGCRRVAMKSICAVVERDVEKSKTEARIRIRSRNAETLCSCRRSAVEYHVAQNNVSERFRRLEDRHVVRRQFDHARLPRIGVRTASLDDRAVRQCEIARHLPDTGGDEQFASQIIRQRGDRVGKGKLNR